MSAPLPDKQCLLANTNERLFLTLVIISFSIQISYALRLIEQRPYSGDGICVPKIISVLPLNANFNDLLFLWTLKLDITNFNGKGCSV